MLESVFFINSGRTVKPDAGNTKKTHTNRVQKLESRAIGTRAIDFRGCRGAARAQDCRAVRLPGTRRTNFTFEIGWANVADSTEDTARSSLRQRLFRLRNSVGFDLIVSDEPLRLEPSLEVDAVRFESLIFTSEHTKAFELEGELLAGNDYDDCPDLNDWVFAARERLESSRQEALASEANRLEASGDYSAALKRAEQFLLRDPISEDGHRRVMRLHYLAGDRPAAIRAFERCQTVLESQLGVEPLIETQNLAKLISNGDLLPQTAPVTRINLPLQVLRPPVLAGRSHEWAQLEAAWEAGQVVFISGSPGSGKTRLMIDFASSKGNFSSIEGRTGDAGVPYSTHARNLKRTLATIPKMFEQLEPWVRRELSRLLPELEPEAPSPIRDENEKLRFFQAIEHVTQRVVEHGIACIVLDDIQFMDAGSFEVGTFITSRSLEEVNCFPRSLNAFRTDELSPEILIRVHELVSSGSAILIALEPLSIEAVGTMLEGIEISDLERLAPALTQYTGGNPLFIVETIKHLIETKQINLEFPTQLPPPGKVGALIRHRLESLSSGALRLARVAAVAGTDFSFELATNILEVGALELTEPLSELEQAQVLVGERFAHDLIFEATLEGVPTSIQNLVHKRTAEYLESHNGNPARIAQHCLAAGEPLQAVPFLKHAAVQALRQYQLREAVNYATQGAQILEQARNPELAWDFWEQVRDVLRELEQGDELETVIKALQRTASTSIQRAQTLNAQCDNLYNTGNLIQAKRIALRAIEASKTAQDFNAIAISENNLGIIYWMQGKTTLAADQFALSNQNSGLNLQHCIEQHKPELEVTKARRELALGLANHAVVLDEFGRYQESEVEHKKAIEMLREVRDAASLVQALSNLSINLLDQGRGREALNYLHEAKEQEALLNETTLGLISTNSTLSTTYLKLDEYTQALDYAHLAREAAEASQSQNVFVVLVRLAKLYRILGATQQARQSFGVAYGSPRASENHADTLFREYAVFLLEQGENASELVQQALGALTQGEHLYGWYKTHLELLSHFSPKIRMQFVTETLSKPSLQTMKGLQILALTRGAQTQLELGKAKKALEFSQQAIALLEDYEPDIQRAEVLLTHFQALTAHKHKSTKPFLEQTLIWLLETADNHVPPEYHQSFLTCNPINAAILEAARNANLEMPKSVTLQ